MSDLTFLSLNCEGGKHLELIIPFLKAHTPEVVCLQEVRDMDLPLFKEALGSSVLFEPMSLQQKDGVDYRQGIAVLTPHTIVSNNVYNYAGKNDAAFTYLDTTSEKTKEESQKFSVLHARIKKDGYIFPVATTHFPWTEEGSTTDFQREAIERLFAELAGCADILLCGDFNAPRGREIFSKLTQQFTDNIPPEVTTSIDGAIHRAGPLPFMVDGLFTRGAIEATNVRMQSGISDHMGVMADVVSTLPA